jgi:glutaredoxin
VPFSGAFQGYHSRMKNIKLSLSALLIVLFFAGLACAQTLYKSIGTDGRVVYSDKPPLDGKLAKTMKAEDLPNTALPAGYEAELQRLRQNLNLNGNKSAPAPLAVASGSNVLFTAVWCGYCRQAKAYLANKGVQYEAIDIDTPSGKSTFAATGGSGGIPLLVANGKQIRGFSTQAYDKIFVVQK